MVRVDLDGGRTEDEVWLEFVELGLDRGVEPSPLLGEVPVGEATEARRGESQEGRGADRFFATPQAVLSGRFRRHALLAGAVGRDPDADRLGTFGVQGQRAARAQRLIVGMSGEYQ